MKTVLVIEDDQDIAELLGDVLAAEGYKVVTAFDGKEGLDQLREVKPDLVLSNVMLPKVSGLELARAVHDDPGLPKVPVVLMSDDWEPGPPGLYSAFVSKPFALDGLVKTIGEQIGETPT